LVARYTSQIVGSVAPSRGDCVTLNHAGCVIVGSVAPARGDCITLNHAGCVITTSGVFSFSLRPLPPNQLIPIEKPIPLCYPAGGISFGSASIGRDRTSFPYSCWWCLRTCFVYVLALYFALLHTSVYAPNGQDF